LLKDETELFSKYFICLTDGKFIILHKCKDSKGGRNSLRFFFSDFQEKVLDIIKIHKTPIPLKKKSTQRFPYSNSIGNAQFHFSGKQTVLPFK
jgi:hypothetical protein